MFYGALGPAISLARKHATSCQQRFSRVPPPTRPQFRAVACRQSLAEVTWPTRPQFRAVTRRQRNLRRVTWLSQATPGQVEAHLGPISRSVASRATDKSKRSGIVVDAGLQHCVTGSRKRPRTPAGRTATRLRDQVGTQIREFRTDAGISWSCGRSRRITASLLGSSGVAANRAFRRSPRSPTHSGPTCPLVSTRTPGAGADHIQARIVEELLRIAHPRWRRFAEVPVYRPARGRIDVVMHHSWRGRHGRDGGPLTGAAARAATRLGAPQGRVAAISGPLGPPRARARGRSAPRHRSTRATRELAELRIHVQSRVPGSGGGRVCGCRERWRMARERAVVGGRHHDAVRILDRPPRGVMLGR